MMIKQKNFTLALMFIFLLFHSVAQNASSFYPFKGFHVGVTGQAEFINKSNYVYLAGPNPAPCGVRTYGWEAGIEFSYHFAKYFGVAIGINYGTVCSYDLAIYLSAIPNQGGWKEVNRYEPMMHTFQCKEILFPVKFEFHYPLWKNFFFAAEAGIKIRGVLNRWGYGKGAIGEYSGGYTFSNFALPGEDKPEEIINILYYDQRAERDLSTIYCDLLLGIGLYYKLPYGDLLRFTAGVNLSFKNTMEGYYYYYPTDYYPTESYGTFSVKNDFIYTQLSYIHTLNFQKAKKYVKKNDYSFSSKKERRKKIYELLNVWQ